MSLLGAGDGYILKGCLRSRLGRKKAHPVYGADIQHTVLRERFE